MPKRLFAAVKIEPDRILLNRYEALQRLLSKESIKWVDPHNLHVTLKFFGETFEDKIPGICDALSRAGRQKGKIGLEINGPGIFGSRYAPRVVWLGINEQGKLSDLHKEIQIELKTLGYEPDNQNFVPHLTIGRIKSISNKKYFQEVFKSENKGFIQSTPIEHYHLFESKLFNHGPEYSIIETFDLI